MSLGERLKEARVSKGLTQVHVAKTLGIGNTALSNYERGERNPDTELLKRLAEFYGITADYLLGIPGGQVDLLEVLKDKNTDVSIGGRILDTGERMRLADLLIRSSGTNPPGSNRNFGVINITHGNISPDNLYYNQIDRKIDNAVIVASHQGRQVIQQITPELRELIKQEIIQILEQRKEKKRP